MSSEAFVIAAARSKEAVEAIRLATQEAGVRLARVQDCIVAWEQRARGDAAALARDSGLGCPAATVDSALRAMFFAGQATLSGDIDLCLVAGIGPRGCTALMLAGAEAVGRWNLMPRARLAVRSLTGPETAYRAAGIASADVDVNVEGDRLGLVFEILEKLEKDHGRWGMVRADPLALLLEKT